MGWIIDAGRVLQPLVAAGFTAASRAPKNVRRRIAPVVRTLDLASTLVETGRHGLLAWDAWKTGQRRVAALYSARGLALGLHLWPKTAPLGFVLLHGTAAAEQRWLRTDQHVPAKSTATETRTAGPLTNETDVSVEELQAPARNSPSALRAP